MHGVAFDRPELYRSSFLAVPLPDVAGRGASGRRRSWRRWHIV